MARAIGRAFEAYDGHKDPITAQGITDAFRDAEDLAGALDDAFTGGGLDEAMAAYQRRRDEKALPMFELTCDFAKLEPPAPEMQQLLLAVRARQETMDDFVSVIAGTVSPSAFFAPENVERIMKGGLAAAIS